MRGSIASICLGLAFVLSFSPVESGYELRGLFSAQTEPESLRILFPMAKLSLESRLGTEYRPSSAISSH